LKDIFPNSRLARWIIAPPSDVNRETATLLTSGLYASIPIFLGGIINSIAVAAVAVSRHPIGLFRFWFAAEVILGLSRLAIIILGNRAQRFGRTPPIHLAILLSCIWAASVGFGAFISIASEDWVLATITCLSTAGMVSGICLRNFGTPRLVALMMLLSLVPCATAALLSKETILVVITFQLPIYMIAIGSAAFKLNAMLVARMNAQEALEQSEAFNRSILEASPDYTLLLDENARVAFCKTPRAKSRRAETILGRPWLALLPPENRAEAIGALKSANAGKVARLTIGDEGPNGRRWFDLAVSRVADGSRRILIVARDITHQKDSEERALWMANHDPLTGLPNRVVLQDFLERLPNQSSSSGSWALLVLDIDNFKVINDTLGHDAGDAMLCAFAERLRSAVRREDLIARLAGDEFAIVLHASSEEEVTSAAQKIFDELHQPLAHNGRLLECNASIGASLYPRDGSGRSELMKAADIALYCAKTGGRGQLKIFHNSMRNDFQSRNSMMFLARRALATGDVLPYYQPKVSLRTGEVIGFEALLRWKDSAGRLRLPDDVKAAFEDPVLSAAISERMISQTLSYMRNWLDAGVHFGHVAINVAASEFRSGRFAEELLEKMELQKIAPRYVQIEVTETVFLGRGADHVERALRRLNDAGIRIALDDFGTGYASLAQLLQFPVDALKIDKSFIRGIGRNADAEAITKAIVNLGHSLDIEIIAEGIETLEQEVYLKGLGCQTGQGYLYSKAAPMEMVSEMLVGTHAKSA
jgi:diguanylate cyclase (GGDEF)-like protein/PAS domain S-box-containing protein